MADLESKVNNSIGWLNGLLEIFEKYNFKTIAKAIVTLFMIVTIIQIRYTPGAIIERYRTTLESQHEDAKKNRIKNEDKINELLPTILSSRKADRVGIIQYHNGTLDGSYGSMKFEIDADDIHPIKDEFKDFPLSLLPLSTYLRNNEYFKGTTDELLKIDSGMGKIYEAYGIEYSVCLLIKNNNKELGILGLTGEEIPTDQDVNKVLKYVGKLEELL